MQTHLYEHSMMYGDASPHEYRQTLVESYLNHYSKEVESLDEASTLSSVQARDYIDWLTISVYSDANLQNTVPKQK